MAAKAVKELARVERPGYLSPFRDMERWFEETWDRPFSMMRTFWPVLSSGDFETTTYPLLDLSEEGGDLVVKAELPGIKKEDVTITLNDNMLTISGETKMEKKVDEGKYSRYERRYGSFTRTIELPFDVETEKPKAHLENGILEIRLPKSKKTEEKTRKIEITG